MVAAVFDGSEENFDDDSKQQPSVIAMRCNGLSRIADTLTGLTNTLIAEKGLGENTYIDAAASLLTAMSLDLGRKFEVIKQSLKPKEKFRDLVESLGKTLPFVNKLIRAARVADNFPAQTAYMLGIDMLAQLAQSKYANLIDDFVDHPPESQLEASDRMKEWRDSQPKKPKTPWKYVGAHKTSDGLAREYQVPCVSETAGLAIERESELSNLPPRIILEQAVQAFVEPDRRVEELQIAASEGLLYKENFQRIELRAKEFEAEAKELRNIKAENMQLEEEAQQVEAIASDLVEQFPSTLFFKSLITPTPAVEVPLQQEVSTRFSSLTPPTERYMLGWNPGDQVIANSVVPTFEWWCQGKPVLIESVQGSVGSVQQLTVVRCDGESRMSFGNWVEEIKSESDAPLSPTLPLASPQTLYLVGKTKNDWEGEIVQLITAGPVYHRVSRLECKEWTHVKHAYLQEISFEEAVTAQAALSEEILAEVGLRLGDTVQWKIEDVTLTGTISRLTKLGAFIDEGQPGLAWIEYHRIQKVQSVASLDPETNNNQQSDCSQATDDAAVVSVEVDYELLSDALKKAANWQEVEQLVERDSSRLTFAVKEWTPVQKNSLRNFLTSYLESDADALIWHQVDWLPLTSLEKSFKQLFFKVRNIMEGLTAPWLNGFAFVNVDDFGLDTEEWTFIDPASSQNIKVCDRKDFAVQAS